MCLVDSRTPPPSLDVLRRARGRRVRQYSQDARLIEERLAAKAGIEALYDES